MYVKGYTHFSCFVNMTSGQSSLDSLLEAVNVLYYCDFLVKNCSVIIMLEVVVAILAVNLCM